MSDTSREVPVDDGAEGKPRGLLQRPWVQRLLMIAVVLVVAGIGKATGLWDLVSLDAIQAWTHRAGWLAVPLFLGLFVACNSLAVPGLLFVLGGLLAFGPVLGVPVVVVGGASAGTFATWWMRKVGGKTTGPPASPIARRIQKRLEDRPVAAVAMLRFVTRLAPPSHMLLALAGVSPVQNFVGTMVGFAPRVVVVAVFLEPVVAWFTKA
jgi:uncharacterized membrane protein YdjX (TVP38/TMEM64 family)